MKKLLSYIKNSAFLPICAGIAAIQPQLSAQIQELYFNDVTDNDSTYISDISNWYTDTSRTTPFTGTLDGNQNGNVSGSGEFAIKVAAFNTPTFNNLTYETEGASKDFDFLVLGNDTVLTINGDLTTNFSLGNDGTFSQRTAGLVLWAKSTLHVKGDWIISSNRAESSNYQAVKITTGGDDINGSVLVDGNIISKGPDNIIFSTVRGDFKVGGTIDLNGSQWNLASTTSANTYTREIGGLGKANGGNDRVRMNITNTSTEPSNAVVNLIFKNKSSYEATTAFSRAKTDNAKLNITMMVAHFCTIKLLIFDHLDCAFLRSLGNTEKYLIGLGKAIGPPFDQPCSFQFPQSAGDTGNAALKIFRQPCQRIEHICPALCIHPAVLLRKGHAVQQQNIC